MMRAGLAGDLPTAAWEGLGPQNEVHRRREWTEVSTDTQQGPDTRDSLACGTGGRVAFAGALTFTLPTRPDAF